MCRCYVVTIIADDFDDEFEEGVGPADIRLVPGTRVPKAPAPKAAPLDAGEAHGWGMVAEVATAA